MTMTKADDPARADDQKKYDAALAEARKLSAEADEAHAKTMTDKPGVPLTQRYRDAVREFRISYALLAADDRRCNRPGFGAPPESTEPSGSAATILMSGLRSFR